MYATARNTETFPAIRRPIVTAQTRILFISRCTQVSWHAPSTSVLCMNAILSPDLTHSVTPQPRSPNSARDHQDRALYLKESTHLANLFCTTVQLITNNRHVILECTLQCHWSLHNYCAVHGICNCAALGSCNFAVLGTCNCLASTLVQGRLRSSSTVCT